MSIELRVLATSSCSNTTRTYLQLFTLQSITNPICIGVWLLVSECRDCEGHKERQEKLDVHPCQISCWDNSKFGCNSWYFILRVLQITRKPRKFFLAGSPSFELSPCKLAKIQTHTQTNLVILTSECQSEAAEKIQVIIMFGNKRNEQGHLL